MPGQLEKCLEIFRTNHVHLPMASQGGSVGGSSTANTHAPENLSHLGSCLSQGQFLPPVLGAEFVPPQDDQEGKPQGQGWVVAERKQKLSPGSTTALCSPHWPLQDRVRPGDGSREWPGVRSRASLDHPSECGVPRRGPLVSGSQSAQSRREGGLTHKEQLRTIWNQVALQSLSALGNQSSTRG